MGSPTPPPLSPPFSITTGGSISLPPLLSPLHRHHRFPTFPPKVEPTPQIAIPSHHHLQPHHHRSPLSAAIHLPHRAIAAPHHCHSTALIIGIVSPISPTIFLHHKSPPPFPSLHRSTTINTIISTNHHHNAALFVAPPSTTTIFKPLKSNRHHCSTSPNPDPRSSNHCCHFHLSPSPSTFWPEGAPVCLQGKGMKMIEEIGLLKGLKPDERKGKGYRTWEERREKGTAIENQKGKSAVWEEEIRKREEMQ